MTQPEINCTQKGSKKKRREERDVKTSKDLYHLCRSTLESGSKGKEHFKDVAGVPIHAQG